MPSARCVPTPSAAGSSHAATPSTASATKATTAQVHRSPEVALRGLGAVGGTASGLAGTASAMATDRKAYLPADGPCPDARCRALVA